MPKTNKILFKLLIIFLDKRQYIRYLSDLLSIYLNHIYDLNNLNKNYQRYISSDWYNRNEMLILKSKKQINEYQIDILKITKRKLRFSK